MYHDRVSAGLCVNVCLWQGCGCVRTGRCVCGHMMGSTSIFICRNCVKKCRCGWSRHAFYLFFPCVCVCAVDVNRQPQVNSYVQI